MTKAENSFEDRFDKVFTNPNTPELWVEVKDFIKQELTRTREETRKEMIEEIRKIPDINTDRPGLEGGLFYEQALSDVITLLQEKPK